MKKFKIGWQLKNNKFGVFYPKLGGARIDLSPPELKDYQQWSDVRRRNQDFLKPYEPQWAKEALTEDFFKRRLEIQAIEMESGRGLFLLIHHRENKNIIGGFNLNNIQFGAACFASLGYWLDQEYLNQGYMQEAGALVIEYAFDVLNLHRLNAACLPDNHRSLNLLLKLGFQEEGFAAQYLQINGQWQDHRLFGLINPKF